MKKTLLLFSIYLFMLVSWPATAAAQQAHADAQAPAQIPAEASAYTPGGNLAQAAPGAGSTAPNAPKAGQIDIIAQDIPPQAHFAAPFDVRFEVAHEPGYITELNKTSLPQGFELTAEKVEKLSPGTSAYQLTFLPFTLGVSTFTAVTFELKEQAGGKTLASVSSEPKNLDVQPVNYFNEKTLREIRPPYIPSSWLIWLLCLVVLGLIIYFARKFYQDIRNRRRTILQTQDNRPPDVIALSKIEALLQSGLWEKAQYKMFYIELGDILREYFWRRFHQDVSSDTSSELLRRARKITQLAPLFSKMREYLNSADLVKFAKVVPSQDTMQQDVNTVREIVRETSPRELKEAR